MIRKRIVTLLIALLVPMAMLVATPWVQVGGNVGYGVPVSSGDGFVDGFSELDSYRFGAEARLNLFDWVSLTVPTTFSLTFDSFSLQPSVNLNIPVSFVDFALGLGCNVGIERDGEDWTINGLPFSSIGEAFKHTGFVYRAALTFNAGFLGIGVAAMIPAQGDFSCMNTLDAWKPDFDSTTLSASVLVNFF